MTLAIKIADHCPHCGERLEVWFKRDMDGGPLMAALARFDLSSWRVVRGFGDALALGDGYGT